MIKDFQASKGLVADGIMGPITAKALAVHLGLECDMKQAAHFLGQCHHESAGFTISKENLNYSESGLLRIFSKYFTHNAVLHPDKKAAVLYARKPEAIANVVYANRMGNGDTASGDGWKFRGRGPLQLTGRNNYQAFADSVQNLCIMDDPDLIISDYYFQSALFFFRVNKLWNLCGKVDNESIIALTKRINGGTNGLQDRISYTYKYYKWLTQ